MWLIAQALVASSVGETAVMGGALQHTIPIVLVAGACLVLAPLAVYFALSDD
jgi:hypothetical protein